MLELKEGTPEENQFKRQIMKKKQRMQWTNLVDECCISSSIRLIDIRLTGGKALNNFLATPSILKKAIESIRPAKTKVFAYTAYIKPKKIIKIEIFDQ